MKNLARHNVIKTWGRRGIKDFYLSFKIRKEFPQYSSFFLQQGLEKICKAYILGKREVALRYESLQEDARWKEVDKIAKDKSKMGHNLEEMIKMVLPSNILSKVYKMYDDNTKVDGKECVKILERAYLECRYPVPDTVSKKYGRNLLVSKKLRTFAYEAGLEVRKKIKQDYGTIISLNKFKTIGDKKWLKFRKLFLKLR